jgi:hypothetical protein
MKDGNFFSRWSRRKIEAKAGDVAPGPPADPLPSPTVDRAAAALPQPLPPVDALTPDSDFTPFMAKGVDDGVKREALKTLFRDPRFNVMDGLDVYIDDYSKPDPLPEGWVQKLNQFARLDDWKPKSPEAPVSPEKPALEEPLAAASPPAALDTPGDGKPPSEVG